MFNASDTRNEQAYLAGYKQFAQSGCMGRHFCGKRQQPQVQISLGLCG
ncbi:MAG: hypothetical protein E7H02_09900 [Veillonella sp.]|nr:hypothetical protein [Veillonella sp.]